MTQRAQLPPEGSRKLFRTSAQNELFGEPSLEEATEQLPLAGGLPSADDAARLGPVECLGMTFDTDGARRAYFLDRLREKLQDPDFRRTEGFPIAEDEDILRLSDPPYYTACPNPFLADFVRHYGKPYDPSTPYHVEPFAVDVSEGKTDALYRAHGYHTKVPHLAIVPPILHYTEPGDLVLDGFAGSGMTGVAAQWCGAAPEAYRRILETQFDADGWPAPRWGARRAILNDLGPAATFIAANYNLPFDVEAFASEARTILREIEQDLGWMYETRHTDGRIGRIEYTVWSEVFTCPNCSGEVVFLREALDPVTKRVKDQFPCPHCQSLSSKDNLQRIKENLADPATGEPWQRVKFVPALISYAVGKTRYEKAPDDTDRQVLQRITSLPLPSSVPTDSFPIQQMYHGSRLAPKGFTRVHHLFLPRAAQALGILWARASAHSGQRLRIMLLFFVEQSIWGMSLLNRYGPTHFSQVNRQLSGVYYVTISDWHGVCSPRVREVHDGTTEEGAGAVAADLAGVGRAVGDDRADPGRARPAGAGAGTDRPAGGAGRGHLPVADRLPVELAPAGVSG